ncbi:MAG: hypothetical protein IIZ26_00680 [Oscillospiraceae bacterium]|nr:hypothetical protein [Oscillospiraceae bacterium]
MKRWTLLLAAFFLLAVLSACGGKMPTDPGTPGNSETPPETVTPVELPEDTNEDPAPPEIAEGVPQAVADTLAELIYNSPDTFSWRLIKYAQFVMGQRSNGRWYLYDMGTGGYSPEHFPVEFP